MQNEMTTQNHNDNLQTICDFRQNTLKNLLEKMKFYMNEKMPE